MWKAVLGLAPLPLDCRDCSAHALGRIYWAWVLICIPGFLAYVYLTPMLPNWAAVALQIAVFTIGSMLGITVATRMSMLKSKWPKLQPPTGIFHNPDGMRDGPAPHTPVPPPPSRETPDDKRP